MPARKPDAEKYCEACGVRMQRNRMPSALESHGQFAKRRFCSEQCRHAGPKVHGTEWGYTRGCRCDQCIAARTVAWRRRALRRRGIEVAESFEHGTADGFEAGCRCGECRQFQDVPHGTVTGYQWHRCRCLDCRTAATQAARQRAQSRRSSDVPPHVIHGTANAAYNYGCACLECRDFANRKNAERRSQTNARLLEVATRHGQVWTGRELELLATSGMSETELAASLGRTLYSIRSARERLRCDPDAVARGGFTTGS